MSKTTECPRCGGAITKYRWGYRCYRGSCMWSSEDDGAKRDARGDLR